MGKKEMKKQLVHLRGEGKKMYILVSALQS